MAGFISCYNTTSKLVMQYLRKKITGKNGEIVPKIQIEMLKNENYQDTCG